MGSSIDRLFEISGINAGAVPSTGAAPAVPGIPQNTAPVAEPAPSSTLGYLGDVTRLFGQAANPFYWPDINRDFHNRSLRTVAENFWDAGKRGLAYAAETIVSPRGANGVPLNVQQDITEAALGVAETQRALMQNPSQVIPQLIQGVVREFVEPTLRTLTGNRILGDEIVPATEEEMAQGLQSTASLLIAGGIYTKLAKASATIRAGQATTRVQRVGRMARNIGSEMRAQAISGMAQEVLAHPDEFDLESVINNVANPIVLLTSVGGGLNRGRLLDKAERKNFLADAADVNTTQLNDLPTAKQVAVNASSTLDEAFAAVDALATSDSWLEAAFTKLKKTADGTFLLVGATADQVGAIYKKYVGEPLEVKPRIDKLPPVPQSAGGIYYYFKDNFDSIVFQAEDLGKIADEYGLSLESVKDLRAQLDAAVVGRNIPTQVSTFNGKVNFRFKEIPAGTLPAPKAKPRVYLSKNGTMLATMQPLAKGMIDLFERTGFLPKEDVVYKGMDVKVEGLNKNGTIRVRSRDGKVRSTTIEQLAHKADGARPVWSNRTFADDVIEEALEFAEKQIHTNQPFSAIIQRFGKIKKWNEADTLNFENLLYRTVADRAEKTVYGPLYDPLDIKFRRDKNLLDEVLNKERVTMRDASEAKLEANGYRIEPTVSGYKLIDIHGAEIGKFRDMDELFDMVARDFVDVTAPDLNPTSFPITNSLQALSPRMQAVHRYMDAKGWTQKWNNFKVKPIVATGLRKIDKAVEDAFERAGMGAQGFDLSRNMEILMNSINAAEQGIYKPIMERVNKVVESAKILTPDQKKLVTRALEQRSFKELFDALDDDMKLRAEGILDFFREAGGNSVVKADYKAFLDGKDATGRVFKIENLPPERRAAVELLHKYIEAGEIQDERILRYIDAIEDGVDLTAEQWIATQPKWDKNVQRVYEQSKEFYSEAKDIFGIEGEITGYAPWITKWRGVSSIYNKSHGAESSFIHELRRIGITDIADRVLDIDELAYRYAKTAIHHKSPVAGRPGQATGQLTAEINRQVFEGRAAGVDVTLAERWLQNLKGVPSVDEAAERAYIKAMEEQFQRSFKGSGIDTAMNVVSLFKLGGRPLLAARDAVSSYGIGLLYGIDAANAIVGITAEKLKRITQLSAEGHLPQFDASEILSRMGKGKLNWATDKGMQLSGQQLAYKVVAGNMYLHTYDKVIEVLRKYPNDTQRIVKELGPLLDTGSRASQDWFLATIQRDPAGAARGLAARNAHGVANRFGRLNNPLAWQSSFGRVYGQFGSWGLNAMTTMGESIANSNSIRSAAWKMGKLTAYNAAIIYTGYETGMNLSNWWLNPSAMFPTGGPLARGILDTVEGFSMLSNTDEDIRQRGINQIYSAGTLLTPTVLMDIYEAGQIANDLGDDYLTIMRAMGMKISDERMDGYEPSKLNIPKGIIQGAINTVTDQ